MRSIEAISEHEMVVVFLQAEVASSRFGPEILRLLARDRIDRAIVDSPDLTDTAENAYRLKLLGEFRGYRQNTGLFAGFPDTVAWQRVALSRDELAAVKYINYSYWVKLSGGSRLAMDAAQAIRAGHTVFGMPTDGFLLVADALQHGAAFPELICVRAREGGRLVVLEGHVRLTAYALAPETIPHELTVILGTAADITTWGCY